MKKKTKYLGIIIFIIVLVGVIATPIITKISDEKEFTTKLSQCKEIIEDTDTILSTEQIKFIEDFEKKHYNGGSYDAKFTAEFIPYLKTKMKERLTFDDADDINKLIVVSRLIALNSNKEVDDLRLKLINRNVVSAPNQTTDTSSEPTESSNNELNNDEQVWQYCVDRWAYYDKLEGKYSADIHTDDVFNDASAKFGIPASEAQSKWDKIDKEKLGVSD